MRMRFPVIACLVFLVTLSCRGELLLHSVFPKHASSQLHGKMVDGYLGPDHPLNSIYKDVSNYHDNSVKWFRKEFGACPGNHRLIGHGSALGEEISKEEERQLREAMRKSKNFQRKFREKTGRPFTKAEEDKVIRKYKAYHKRESQGFLRRIMEMGYSKEDALLILRDASNTHFIGDITSDNAKKYISLVKPVAKILEEKIEFAKRFYSHKDYKKIKSEYKRIQAIENQQKRADAAERHQKGMGKKIRTDRKSHSLESQKIVDSRHLKYKVRRARSPSAIARQVLRWRRALAIRAGISRVAGGVGSAVMMTAPSLGGLRAGKTTMDVAVDASVMLAGYSASQSASAMVAGTIGSGGAFAVAMVVQMVIAQIAYGLYEQYQNVRRERRDFGVLKARIDRLNQDDELLDRIVGRTIEQNPGLNLKQGR